MDESEWDGVAWSVISIRKALITAVRAGLQQFQRSTNRGGDVKEVARTDRDIPIHLVGRMVLCNIIPLDVIFSLYTGNIRNYIVME